MSDGVAVGDGEVFVAELLVGEGFFDVGGDGGKAVGVGGFDVDLLDLSGAGDFVETAYIHDKGIVKIDVVEIDGLFDFVEDADDHEFFAHDGDGLADGAVDGIKEGEGKRVAEDDGIAFVLLGEEGAIAEGEGFDFGEIASGAENGDGVKGVFVGGDGVGRDGDGGGSGDVWHFGDSGDVVYGKIGFLERIGGGEFLDDIGDGVFGGTGANDDEVGTDFFGLVFDEIGNAAHEGENQDNAGYADGDTEASEERPSAVLPDGGLSEPVVSSE